MRHNHGSPPPVSVQKLPCFYNLWGNTDGSVPKNWKSECCTSLPSTLYILESVVMIYSLEFKVLHIQNECWRHISRSACAIHSFKCNLCPVFSRECLTWHWTKFMRVKSLHKGKCWKFITSVSPCGKIMWFTENLKNEIKTHNRLEAGCFCCTWSVFFWHLANCTAACLAKIWLKIKETGKHRQKEQKSDSSSKVSAGKKSVKQSQTLI